VLSSEGYPVRTKPTEGLLSVAQVTHKFNDVMGGMNVLHPETTGHLQGFCGVQASAGRTRGPTTYWTSGHNVWAHQNVYSNIFDLGKT